MHQNEETMWNKRCILFAVQVTLSANPPLPPAVPAPPPGVPRRAAAVTAAAAAVDASPPAEEFVLGSVGSIAKKAKRGPINYAIQGRLAAERHQQDRQQRQREAEADLDLSGHCPMRPLDQEASVDSAEGAHGECAAVSLAAALWRQCANWPAVAVSSWCCLLGNRKCVVANAQELSLLNSRCLLNSPER